MLLVSTLAIDDPQYETVANEISKLAKVVVDFGTVEHEEDYLPLKFLCRIAHQKCWICQAFISKEFILYETIADIFAAVSEASTASD